MNEKDLKQQLREKLDANYTAFVQEWLGLEPAELIERAEEIAATRLVYKDLKNGIAPRSSRSYSRLTIAYRILVWSR